MTSQWGVTPPRGEGGGGVLAARASRALFQGRNWRGVNARER